MTIDELIEAAKDTPVTEEFVARLKELLSREDEPAYISNEFLARTYTI